MTWLLWRQHRLQAMVAAIAVGAFGIVLALTRASSVTTFTENPALDNVVTLTIALPLLMGLFWGVTAVGRELDTGTHLLAWTQSVTKREWLRGKIIVTLTAAALWGGVIAALVTWWSGPVNAAHANRFDPGKFDIQGIVPVAYAVFAAALGLAAGALLRRLLPALAATLAVFVTVRLIVISYVRPYFESAITVHGPLGPPPNLPSGTWLINQSVLLHGKGFTGPFSLPDNCRGTRAAMDACISRLGLTSVVKYQPASRYWTFQYLESGLFIGLAALLTVAAVIAVRRRDAGTVPHATSLLISSNDGIEKGSRGVTLTQLFPLLVTPPPEARPSAMRHAKPHIVTHLHALLSLASEVARNAIAEVRWHRRRERPSESTYRASAAT